jgi:hypothetical protein
MNRARSRGLLARVQTPKQFLFEFDRGLKARGYVLDLRPSGPGLPSIVTVFVMSVIVVLFFKDPS